MPASQLFSALLLALVFCCAGSSLSGQTIPPADSTLNEQAPLLLGGDTLDVAYFYLQNPEVEYAFKDTTLEEFIQFDPVRKRDFDFANLGNLGSAHRSLFYQPSFYKGFRVGFQQFELYKTTTEQLKFYKLRKAFTDAFYSQGATQEDAYFKVDFSRNFANGINYSLSYDRINNAGAYTSQQARAGALTTGFWYHSPKGKYNAYITYASNIIRQKDNGGINAAQLNDQNIEQEFSVPVQLSTAETRHDERAVTYTHSLDINGQPDSVAAAPRAFVVEHQVQYQRSFYKFFDPSPAPDSSFYGALQIDQRGLRHYIRTRQISNTFGLATFKRRKQKNGLRSQRDLFRISLQHQLHLVEQEPLDSTIQNLFLSGQYHFSPGDRLQLETYAHIGFWDNAGDYRLSGRLFVDLQQAGNLELSAISQSYAPSLLDFRFFATEQRLWKNDFDKTFETSLSASYRLPISRTELQAHNHLITNLVYYDTASFARQEGAVINLLQLSAIQELSLGSFHLKSWFTFQNSSSSKLRFPEVFTKHSLYYEGRVFRDVMLMRLGVDFRINTAWQAYTYQPLTGQYHLDEQQVDAYPALDTFIAFKVRYFRAFLRVENISSIFRNDFFYQTTNYPHPYTNFRWGISWQFIN